ncbi:hypothetical protein CERSUDRAFT_125217 [Gelatoporia subvermispora B]|uniref:Cupin 2 conserved barrel domain-containing protein n=1 Tax=Ceriporiopsis subvermispora (strain B) TaxID=914234 RepID=M2PFC4_CERS8|nr:hypothetical protein CERSUDRAFT_125217 [Gelatoporia subvermispora B]
MALPRCLIRTTTYTTSRMLVRTHPLDQSKHRFRFQVPIGDNAGLTKTGVHFCRLPPSTTSTMLHWHSTEDEWFYIIEAGDDAALLLREGDEMEAGKQTDTKEIRIQTGDFLGFAAGKESAHALRSGGAELVYLLGGSREPLDVCQYPELGRRMVLDRAGGKWTVEEQAVQNVEN